jgi:hypothetical protein
VQDAAISFPLSKHTGGGDTAPTFSGLRIYLQFMWEVGLPPSPVEFSSHHHFYKLSRSWLLGVCCCSCRSMCLFTAHVGSGSSPVSCGVFLPLPLSQAFLLLVAGRMPPLPPEPLGPGPVCLFTVPGRIPLPPFRAQGAPTLFATCLYCSFCLLLSFYADLAQGCLWKYRVSLSSPCLRLPKPSGCRRLAAGGPPGFSI